MSVKMSVKKNEEKLSQGYRLESILTVQLFSTALLKIKIKLNAKKELKKNSVSK